MTELMTYPASALQRGSPEALERCDLFAALPPMLLRELAEGSTLRTFRRGERMWTHGTPCDVIAVVATGRVKCWSGGRDGRQWVCAVVRAGGVCGLAAGVDGGTHTCSAEPLERSSVVLIAASAFRAAMELDPAFAHGVAHHLARDVRRVLILCEDVTLRTPVERLARFLAAEAAANGVLELRETQTQIAAQLGTVREVVGRGLRHLESQGVIARTGRLVRILRPRDLDTLAGRDVDAGSRVGGG